MILNAKELIELANDMDKNCIDFAKWIQDKYIYHNGIYNKKTDNYWNSNNLLIEELLEIFKNEKFIEQSKK